jgi:selenocysteine-specific elongation factor
VASGVGARLYSAAELARVDAAIRGLLTSFHAAQPRSAGIPRDELRQRAGPAVSVELFEAVVEAMAGRGEIAGDDRLRLASHDSGLDPEERAAADTVLRVLEEAGLTPPDQADLAASAGLPAPRVAALLSVLARDGRARRIGTLVFHPAALAGLAGQIRSLGSGQEVDVARFKERFGLSRKFAIPLLEWLDRERVTRRRGDVRVVL